MSRSSSPAPAARPLATYAAVALLTLLVLTQVAGPVEGWLSTPLIYRGDGLWNLFVARSVLEEGWYYASDRLGAPFGSNFTDFAKPESLFLAAYALAGLVTDNPVPVHNLFFLAGFVAVAAAAQWVLWRELRLPGELAAAGALLFTFMPYHLLRLSHLFLSFYVAVPLAIWLMLRVAAPNPPFFERGRFGRPAWPVLAVALVVASTSIYYAFFGLLFILAAGFLTALGERRLRPLASALALSALIALLLGANLAPSLLYRAQQGSNPEVATRNSAELEPLALRPAQLLLPVPGHPLPPFAAATERYRGQTAAGIETVAAPLGLIGATGALLLLLRLLLGERWRGAAPPLLLAQANAVALLFAAVGGGGALFALFLSPQFRALNRVSIFIAFFSLAGLLLLLDRLLARHAGRRRRAATRLFALLLAGFGLWDQLPPAWAWRDGPRSLGEHALDRPFFARLEAALPPGAALHTLPYHSFPEQPPRHREPGYTHLRGYLHTRALRFGYGGMRGRPGDRWHRWLAELPLPLQLRFLRAAGFAGVLVERRAYPDGGAELEALLRSQGGEPWERGDGQIAFYPLAGAAAGVGPVPLFERGEGFHAWEFAGERLRLWSAGEARLRLYNPGAQPLAVRLRCELATRDPRTLRIGQAGRELLARRLAPWPQIEPIALELTLPPGESELLFASDEPPTEGGPADPRRLAFMLRDPLIEPLAPSLE